MCFPCSTWTNSLESHGSFWLAADSTLARIQTRRLGLSAIRTWNRRTPIAGKQIDHTSRNDENQGWFLVAKGGSYERNRSNCIYSRIGCHACCSVDKECSHITKGSQHKPQLQVLSQQREIYLPKLRRVTTSIPQSRRPAPKGLVFVHLPTRRFV